MRCQKTVTNVEHPFPHDLFLMLEVNREEMFNVRIYFQTMCYVRNFFLTITLSVFITINTQR